LLYPAELPGPVKLFVLTAFAYTAQKPVLLSGGKGNFFGHFYNY